MKIIPEGNHVHVQARGLAIDERSRAVRHVLVHPRPAGIRLAQQAVAKALGDVVDDRCAGCGVHAGHSPGGVQRTPEERPAAQWAAGEDPRGGIASLRRWCYPSIAGR